MRAYIVLIVPLSSSPPPLHRPPWGDRHPSLASGLVMAAVFAVFGLHSPYFPLWLAARGLDEQAIALIMGVPLVLRLAVASPVARHADGRRDRRPLVTVLLLVTFCAALALTAARGFGVIFVLVCLMMMAYQPVPAIVDATLGSLVRRDLVRDIGRIRVWGSVSFAVVAAAGGVLLEVGGIDPVFWAFLVLLGVTLGVVWLLPSGGAVEQAGQVERFRFRRYPMLGVVMVAIALINASQAMYFSFGSVHMRAIGYPDWSIGLIWTVAVGAEIVVLWFAPAAMMRFGPLGLVLMAALGTVARWCGMAADPPLAAMLGLQLLHASTMSCTYLGWMGFIQRLVEDKASARAQSALMTLSGVLTAAMIFLMGPVYQALGGLAYLVAALLPALAAGLLVAFRHRLR